MKTNTFSGELKICKEHSKSSSWLHPSAWCCSWINLPHQVHNTEVISLIFNDFWEGQLMHDEADSRGLPCSSARHSAHRSCLFPHVCISLNRRKIILSCFSFQSLRNSITPGWVFPFDAFNTQDVKSNQINQMRLQIYCIWIWNNLGFKGMIAFLLVFTGIMESYRTAERL